MSEKKFSNEDIIDAIIFKFGNIEALAKELNTSSANIYQKISRQTTKFLGLIYLALP